MAARLVKHLRPLNEEEYRVGKAATSTRRRVGDSKSCENPGPLVSDSASGYRGPQAGRPPQAPWEWQGEREENGVELGVSFGPNPGAIVHFSTSSLTRPPKRIAARAASQRLPRPFGPRQSHGAAKLRNYPGNFGRHTAAAAAGLGSAGTGLRCACVSRRPGSGPGGEGRTEDAPTQAAWRPPIAAEWVTAARRMADPAAAARLGWAGTGLRCACVSRRPGSGGEEIGRAHV